MKNLKEVLAFAFSLHMTYDKANADGKIDIMDAGLLIDPLTKLMPAVQDIKLAKDELDAATDADMAELKDWIKASYDIADDALEAKVEEGVAMVASIAKFVGSL